MNTKRFTSTAVALIILIPEPQQFNRLVPVQLAYRDPRQILTIQKREQGTESNRFD